MIIAQQDARQAIRETLAEARINDDDAAYIETLFMRRLNDYKVQPLDLKEAKEALNLCESEVYSHAATYRLSKSPYPDDDASLPNSSVKDFQKIGATWIRRFIEAVNG